MMKDRLKEIDGIDRWEYSGDSSIVDMPTIAILLSRQSRRPNPSEWWIRAVVESARLFAAEGNAFLCGGRIPHLDFARWACHRFGKTSWLDFASPPKANKSNPVPDWCHLRLEPILQSKTNAKDTMILRDRSMAASADKIVAAFVRKGGNIEKMCRSELRSGKHVFAVEPPPDQIGKCANMNLIEAGATPLKISYAQPASSNYRSSKSGEQMSFSFPINGSALVAGEYLWHFTRECAGPWPDETWDEYFESLAAGKPESAHEAYDSLVRIIRSGAILAGGGPVRGGHKVVCWTASSPLDIAKQPKYRSALARWDYKPYAVGVRREVMEKMGARPARYGGDELYHDLPESERYLFQHVGKKSEDWRRESEWRTAGDFHFDKIDHKDMLALVENEEEKSAIEKLNKVFAVPLKNLS